MNFCNIYKPSRTATLNFTKNPLATFDEKVFFFLNFKSIFTLLYNFNYIIKPFKLTNKNFKKIVKTVFIIYKQRCVPMLQFRKNISFNKTTSGRIQDRSKPFEVQMSEKKHGAKITLSLQTVAIFCNAFLYLYLNIQVKISNTPRKCLYCIPELFNDCILRIKNNKAYSKKTRSNFI